MQTLTDIKRLLEERGMMPKKALGQNFLIDHNLITRLIDVSGVGEGDLVLEVGPGTGALTGAMLERGCRVIACELDNGLIGLLEDTLCVDYPETFTLIEGDCLENKRELSAACVAAIDGRPFTLVANLPYGAGTPVILTLLARHPNCRGVFATIQREVADRLLASPGSKAFGSISVIAQALCQCERIATLPRECFWPRPDVTSAMVGLTRLEHPPAGDDPAWWPVLADWCQAIFAGRRKQLGKSLKAFTNELDWPPGIEPTARAEVLKPDQIIALANALHQAGASPLANGGNSR